MVVVPCCPSDLVVARTPTRRQASGGGPPPQIPRRTRQPRIAMSAPAAARASAVARPIPIPPPVTRPTRSRRSAIGALGRTFYLTDQQQRVLNNIAPAV